MEQVTQGYKPLDLDQVRKDLKKVFVKVTNEKELDREIDEISQAIKDTSKSYNKPNYNNFSG